MEALEVRRRACGGGRALDVPVDSRGVVVEVPDGCFLYIDSCGNDVVLGDACGELEVTVGDGPAGVVLGEELLDDVAWKRVPPHVALVIRCVGGGVVRRDEENASHAMCGGVGGADRGWFGRDEFEESERAVVERPGDPAEVIQEIVGVLGEAESSLVWMQDGL